MSRLEWLNQTSGRVVEALRQLVAAQTEFQRGTQERLEGDDCDAIVNVSVKPANNTEVTIRVTGNEAAKKQRAEMIGELRYATTEVLKNLGTAELTACELDIDLQNLSGGLKNADEAARELLMAIAGLFEGVKKLDGQIQLVSADGGETKIDDAKTTSEEVLASVEQIHDKAGKFVMLFAALLTKSPPFLDDGNAEGKSDNAGAGQAEEAQSEGAQAG